MTNNLEKIHQTPDLHFSICSTNKELFMKFEQAMKKRGLIGIPDLQGNLHYIVDGRKGFPTAYQKVKNTTFQLMEERSKEQSEKIQQVEEIADDLINKYEFDNSLIGTKFLRYMIIHGLMDKSLLVSFSKNLYPAIANIFSSNPDKVCYCTRYTLRKLKKLEDEQRKLKIAKEYLLSEEESYSNRNALYKLIAEGESRLQIDEEGLIYENLH